MKNAIGDAVGFVFMCIGVTIMICVVLVTMLVTGVIGLMFG